MGTTVRDIARRVAFPLSKTADGMVGYVLYSPYGA